MAIFLIAGVQYSKADNSNLIFKDNKPSLEMKQEKNVNDIPFNTLEIFQKYLSCQAMKKVFRLENEENANDIPFNTWQVYFDNQLTMFQLKEEKNVDDIEVNTSLIASKYLRDRKEYKLQEESEVKDIPFNTACFAISNPGYWKTMYRLDWEEYTYFYFGECGKEIIPIAIPGFKNECIHKPDWYINWKNRKQIYHNKKQQEFSRVGVLLAK